MGKRLRTGALLGLSLLGVSAGAATAQTTSATDPPTETAGAPAGLPAPEEDAQIIVTGVRASLQRAQEIKRGASSVVEAITFEDLGKFTDPGGTINFYTAGNGAVDPPVFNGGDVCLRPTSAWNYDATIEYHTKYGASFIAGGFYKDVKDIVTDTQQVNVTIPGEGDTRFTVTSTINGLSGKTYGFEVGTNQPLNLLPEPFNGVGFNANYTYVESERVPPPGSVSTQFTGASKHNVNATAYFEKSGFSARMSLNYRTAFLYETGNGDGYNRPQTTLDAGISQRFLQDLEVILTGSNLTGQDEFNYTGVGGRFRSYFERPRTFSLAVRTTL